jgi:hypothetical protein
MAPNTDRSLTANQKILVIDFLSYLFGEAVDGRNAHLSDGVERALDRKPRDFAEFAHQNALTGVWGEDNRV